MIKGKQILSPHHLYRILEPNKPTQVLYMPDGSHVTLAIALKIDSGYYAKNVILFNRYSDNDRFYFENLRDDEKLLRLCSEIRQDYYGVLTYGCNDGTFARECYGMILLPEDFNTQWESFITSNKKQFNAANSRYGLNDKSGESQAKYLFLLTGGSKNFFFWAVDMHLRKHVRLSQIKEIMVWNDQYNQLSSKLAKGTITAYTNRDQILILTREMRRLRQEKRINDVINSFNTQQKKLLKEFDKSKLTKHDKEAFSKFASLSLTKRTNFIRKMSTIDNVTEILRQLHHITNVLFEWNRESFLDYLTNENVHAHIIQDQGNIILLQVDDYDTVKRLAKNTNWCISKNKKYWNDYVERKTNAKQYMILNFNLKEDDLKSIVGLTSVANNGITAAHDFVNNNLLTDMPAINENQKSYFARFTSKNGIYGILQASNIEIGMVTDVTPFNFTWTRDSFLDYLFKCVSTHHVHVLSDKDNKLCLSVTDSNIRYVLGDSYMHHTSREDYKRQHILFLDFNVHFSSPNAFYYAIIYENRTSHECYCENARNPKHVSIYTSFERLLKKFDLPYDTIKRVDDSYSRFKNDLLSRQWDLTCITEETPEWTKQVAKDNYAELYELIISDIRNLSFDTLNWVYNNGLVLTDLFEISNVTSLLTAVLNNYRDYSSECNQYEQLPSNANIQSFWNENLDNIATTGYVGYYLMLSMLIQNESDQNVISNFLRRIGIKYSRLGNSFVNDILLKISGNINYSEDDSTLSYFIPLVFNAQCSEIIAQLRTLPTLSPFGKQLMASTEAEIADSNSASSRFARTAF